MERLSRRFLYTPLIMTLERDAGQEGVRGARGGPGYVEGELALKSPSGSKVSSVSWQTVPAPVSVPNENLLRTSSLGERES